MQKVCWSQHNTNSSAVCICSTAGTAPEFAKRPSNVMAPLNGEAKFEVEVSGEPLPDVKW